MRIIRSREWELFDTITSAFWGKRYYSIQEDGRIYSRYSQKYMHFDEAVAEFCSIIGDDGVLPDARWKGAGMGDYECTNCGAVFSIGSVLSKYRFCPNCGVHME